MKYFLVAVLAVAMGAAASAEDRYNATSEARDFTGYSPSPASYDSYDPSGTYLNPDKWTQSNLLLPSLSSTGCGAGNLLKPILAGLLGALLLKLPILIAAKILLLKLAVPIGLITAAAPILLPMAYMFFNKKPSSSSSHNDTADSRALEDFLTSSSCLEKVACSIGRSQARSDQVKTFSWLMKSVESMLGAQSGMRSLVGSYRSAYLTGASNEPNVCSPYRCTLPEFFVHQSGRSYKIA